MMLILLTALLTFVSTALAMPGEENLLAQHLLTHYQKEGRPVAHGSDTLDVEFNINILRIMGLCTKSQTLTIKAWIFHKWKDAQLVWDPAQFHGLKRIHLSASKVWLPDIVLFNNGEEDEDYTNYKVVVDHTGDVIWVPSTVLKSLCPIKASEVKCNDDDGHCHKSSKQQTCPLKFGSWVHNTKEMNLKFSTDFAAPFLDELRPNPRISLLKGTAKKNEKSYDCCPDEKFSDLTYTLDLEFN